MSRSYMYSSELTQLEIVQDENPRLVAFKIFSQFQGNNRVCVPLVDFYDFIKNLILDSELKDFPITRRQEEIRYAMSKMSDDRDSELP